MDIHAQKSYLFLHGRFLSACGSDLCCLQVSQINPRIAQGTGHSILTKELVSARMFSSRLPLYSAPSLGANGTKCLIVESASSSKQSAIPSQTPTPRELTTRPRLCRRSRIAPPREIPVAQAIALPDNFPSSAFGFQLLKVRGQILEIAPGLTETALVLKDGDTSFRAIVRGNSAHLALPDVHSVLDLTPASAKPLPAGTPTPSSAPPLALARTAVGALRSSQKQPDRVEMRSETVTYAA